MSEFSLQRHILSQFNQNRATHITKSCFWYMTLSYRDGQSLFNLNEGIFRWSIRTTAIIPTTADCSAYRVKNFDV